MTEDALAANAPHIQDLQKYNIRFVIGVKKWDHDFLFKYVYSNLCNATEYTIIDKDGTIHKFRFANNIPLNTSNQDLLVNFIEYWEIKPSGEKQYFSWITDLLVTKENVYTLMKIGRARWKIENETFNTLKNQWYHFEHNFWHGYKNLATNFGIIMMLAFFIDQIQQKTCFLYQWALKKCKTRRSLNEKIRSYFDSFTISSMKELLEAIMYGIRKPSVKDWIWYKVTWYNNST
jgi:hypothetical protein